MNVGILSFAHVHAPGYAHLLQQFDDVKIAAIADDDEERGRAAQARFGGELYRDYPDLLARDDIEAVIVTSPTAEHRAMVEAAAAAKKHILCEKPLATNRDDAVAIVETCRQHGVKLQTAFPVRFSAPALALRQHLEAGDIGAPLAVMTTNPGKMPPGWFSDPVLAGGGAVMDHSVHVVDLLRWMFGREIVSVYAEVDRRLHPEARADDIALLMLELDGGPWASLDPSWRRPEAWPTWGGLTVDVIGESGVLAMDAFNQHLELFDNSGRQYSFIPWAGGGDAAMLRGFFDAIKNDTTPPVTGEDGLKATEVALCVYASAKRHAPVRCPDVLIEGAERS